MTGIKDAEALRNCTSEGGVVGSGTGPLPWDMQSTATSAEGEGDDGRHSAPGSPTPGSPTAEDSAAEQTGAPTPLVPTGLLPALLGGEPAALAFPPAPRIVPPGTPPTSALSRRLRLTTLLALSLDVSGCVADMLSCLPCQAVFPLQPYRLVLD